MNKTEFKEKTKISSECKIYKIRCNECLTFESGRNYESTIIGLMDGKDQEFYKLENANRASELHVNRKPLHRPRILPPIREYTIHDSRHLIKYRCKVGKGGLVHVHSVDGFEISRDKCAYECRNCGAIYKSKGAGYHRIFPTDDPRCVAELHNIGDISSRICLCPTVEEAETEYQNKLLAKGCICCHRKFTF